MKVSGFSHVTINVQNLERSLRFYLDILNMKLIHKGRSDAYLEWGEAWICLIERKNVHEVDQELTQIRIAQSKRSCPETSSQSQIGVDHIAFYIEEKYFDEAVKTLKDHAVPITRGPVKRGQGWTINFLDPDGTELELHTSTLQERMEVWI